MNREALLNELLPWILTVAIVLATVFLTGHALAWMLDIVQKQKRQRGRAFVEAMELLGTLLLLILTLSTHYRHEFPGVREDKAELNETLFLSLLTVGFILGSVFMYGIFIRLSRPQAPPLGIPDEERTTAKPLT